MRTCPANVYMPSDHLWYIIYRRSYRNRQTCNLHYGPRSGGVVATIGSWIGTAGCTALASIGIDVGVSFDVSVRS